MNKPISAIALIGLFILGLFLWVNRSYIMNGLKMDVSQSQTAQDGNENADEPSTQDGNENADEPSTQDGNENADEPSTQDGNENPDESDPCVSGLPAEIVVNFKTISQDESLNRAVAYMTSVQGKYRCTYDRYESDEIAYVHKGEVITTDWVDGIPSSVTALCNDCVNFGWGFWLVTKSGSVTASVGGMEVWKVSE